MPVIPFVFEPSQGAPFFEATVLSCRLVKASQNSLLLLATAQKSSFTGNRSSISRNWLLIFTRLTSLLNITPDALRDYWQKSTVLDAEESKQILQVVRIIELGQEVFGETAHFNTWLLKPAYGLAGRLPLDLFYSNSDIDLIADELTRIAYGDAV